MLTALILSAAVFTTLHGQQRGAATAPPAAVPALDYYEIHQLYTRFNHALDSADDNGNAFANVFTGDGVFVTAAGTRIEGHDALAAFAREDPDKRKGPTNVGHYVSNAAIDATPSGARSRLPARGDTAAARPGGWRAGPRSWTRYHRGRCLLGRSRPDDRRLAHQDADARAAERSCAGRDGVGFGCCGFVGIDAARSPRRTTRTSRSSSRCSATASTAPPTTDISGRICSRPTACSSTARW
jgi:hypothetical protein